MAFDHTIKKTWSRGAASITSSNTYSGTGQVSIDENIDDGETVLEITFALDISEIASVYLVSDQIITIKTNSSGAPDDTFVLAAGVPLVWTDDGEFANPFSADITSIFIANASGSTARLQIEAVTDATP